MVSWDISFSVEYHILRKVFDHYKDAYENDLLNDLRTG
jgi:hypothetical protein